MLMASQLKRGIKPPLELPDGSTCYPGSEIPECRVIMEELVHDTKVAGEYLAIFDELARKLYRPGEDGGYSHSAHSAIPSDWS